MNTKRTFASVPVPDAIARMAAEAPGGTAAHDEWLKQQVQEAIDDQRSAIPHDEVMKKAADHAALRPVFREREATQKMTVNMPKGLYEELRAYMKLTDIPMSDVLVEGARRELARLKKQDGSQ